MLAFAAGAGVYGQTGAACVPPPLAAFQSISRAEIESMLADIAATNPSLLNKFREDSEMKLAQLDNLRELLAFASAAVKDGLTAEPNNCLELESIRDEVTAVTYDRERNKGKTGPPFGSISDVSIAAYWNGTTAKPHSAKLKEDREAAFQNFLKVKLAQLAADNPAMKDREVSEAESEQAREFYAKVHIYADEYNARLATLLPSFRDNVKLQVKLQQAQFLARKYSEVAAGKTAASDEEIDRFISADPALSTTAKRAKAEQIFERAKKGEDFAALANEFSEDPGNGSESDGKHGGLYQQVRKGQMVAPFEAAALASEPGKVYPGLVETDFGFHILKLEKKDSEDTYDVRHILISTMVKDPANPDGRDIPIKTYVKTALEDEKQRKLIERIVAENRITVPDDFTVPSAAPAKAPVKRVAKPAAKPTTRRTVRKRN